MVGGRVAVEEENYPSICMSIHSSLHFFVFNLNGTVEQLWNHQNFEDQDSNTIITVSSCLYLGKGWFWRFFLMVCDFLLHLLGVKKYYYLLEEISTLVVTCEH